MTLISSIILDGYREANMIGLLAVPNDAQNTEALRLYNALLASLYGTDVGENLADWPLGQFGYDPSDVQDPTISYQCPQYPPINSRIVATNTAPFTVDFTPRPQDGARYALIDPYGDLATFPVTLNGNGRTIGGVPIVTIDTAGSSTEWVYRADKGDWTKITGVMLTDENPFPIEFDQMFIIFLAMRLSPRYGRELTDMSLEILRSGRTAFVARYITSQALVIDDSISWPFMSKQGYDSQRSFSSTSAFNQGYPYGG